MLLWVIVKYMAAMINIQNVIETAVMHLQKSPRQNCSCYIPQLCTYILQSFGNSCLKCSSQYTEKNQTQCLNNENTYLKNVRTHTPIEMKINERKKFKTLQVQKKTLLPIHQGTCGWLRVKSGLQSHQQKNLINSNCQYHV